MYDKLLIAHLYMWLSIYIMVLGRRYDMKFIDLYEEEYLLMRSPLIARMDELPAKKLSRVSNRYNELLQKKSELMDKYEFICKIVEDNDPTKETYTKEELEAMRQFLNIARELDDYERLEIYKLGYHDCIIWMQMIGLYNSDET